jgi:hypothetical protein
MCMCISSLFGLYVNGSVGGIACRPRLSLLSFTNVQPTNAATTGVLTADIVSFIHFEEEATQWLSVQASYSFNTHVILG